MYFEQTYVNAHTSLEIYCLEHGLFKQSPTSHKSGKGCPRCGRLKTRQRLEEEEVNLEVPDELPKHGESVTNDDSKGEREVDGKGKD